jgi:hypothetical protein
MLERSTETLGTSAPQAAKKCSGPNIFQAICSFKSGVLGNAAIFAPASTFERGPGWSGHAIRHAACAYRAHSRRVHPVRRTLRPHRITDRADDERSDLDFSTLRARPR